MRIHQHLKLMTLVIAFSALHVSGCEFNDIKSWTNDTGVIARIKPDYIEPVCQNVEGTFDNYSYNRVFVFEKSSEKHFLSLLFITNSTEERENLKSQLNIDDKVVYARNECYAPFDPIDNRYIECEKSVINVGEIVELTLKGKVIYYEQTFSFSRFYLKTNNSANIYLKHKNIKSVSNASNGWLRADLKTDNYFELIKTIDEVSRLDYVDEIEVDSSVFPLPSRNSNPDAWLWTIKDSTVIEIVEVEKDNQSHIWVKGLKKGKTTIEIYGVSCSIRVV